MGTGKLTSDKHSYGSRRIALMGFAVAAASTVPFAFARPHTSGWVLALWMVIRILAKLGCASRVQAALLACDAGLRGPGAGRGPGDARISP